MNLAKSQSRIIRSIVAKIYLGTLSNPFDLKSLSYEIKCVLKVELCNWFSRVWNSLFLISALITFGRRFKKKTIFHFVTFDAFGSRSRVFGREHTYIVKDTSLSYLDIAFYDRKITFHGKQRNSKLLVSPMV